MSNSEILLLKKTIQLMAEYIQRRNPSYQDMSINLISEIYLREAEKHLSRARDK